MRVTPPHARGQLRATGVRAREQALTPGLLLGEPEARGPASKLSTVPTTHIEVP